MRTDRVVLRTILTTLLAIAVLFGTMLLTLCLLFPSTMMQLTYDLGMEKSSVKYAVRAYKRSEDVYYAAFAFETSVQTGDIAAIEENGILLIKDDDFDKYCQQRNSEIAEGNEGADEAEKITLSYRQYVYGQVTMAQYAQGKKEYAIDTAFASLEGDFPQPNAVGVLFLTAIQDGDRETATAMAEKIERFKLSVEDADSADYKNAQALLDVWQNYKAKN